MFMIAYDIMISKRAKQVLEFNCCEYISHKERTKYWHVVVLSRYF